MPQHANANTTNTTSFQKVVAKPQAQTAMKKVVQKEIIKEERHEEKKEVKKEESKKVDLFITQEFAKKKAEPAQEHLSFAQ